MRETLGIAGIDEINEVDIAVTIRVIIGKIHLVVYHLAGSSHHLIDLGIIVRTVVGESVWHGDRTDNVELWGELSEAHVFEIAQHATVIAVLAIAEVFQLAVWQSGVEVLVECLHGVGN